MTLLRKRMIVEMTVRGLAVNAMRLHLHSVSGLASGCTAETEEFSVSMIGRFTVRANSIKWRNRPLRGSQRCQPRMDDLTEFDADGRR